MEIGRLRNQIDNFKSARGSRAKRSTYCNVEDAKYSSMLNHRQLPIRNADQKFAACDRFPDGLRSALSPADAGAEYRHRCKDSCPWFQCKSSVMVRSHFHLPDGKKKSRTLTTRKILMCNGLQRGVPG